ncbi:MAG: metal-sensitive transcriptional regulator [Candidatus Levybacteria bacterium]|nr:metal-sensitive transcriptional regulator [Candidatus Levybacteria bacterium]
MHTHTADKKRVIHRLKIARGHLDKVISMVEDDTYCIDVLTQSQAVQSALAGVDSLLLSDHLENCVSEQIKSGKSKKAFDEILNVFKRGR